MKVDRADADVAAVGAATGQGKKARIPAWLLGALPPIAVALLLTYEYWSMYPRSDGAIFFYSARNAWSLPLRAENFWSDWLHKESYVSIGLLGLAYHAGLEPVAALRLLQCGLFAAAVLSFSVICATVFRGIATVEVALLTLVFAISPAYLAYFVGVAIDFIALAFLLAYLAALCTRRFGLAALVGTAFAFSKETSFLVYSLTLPLVLVYGMRRFDPPGSASHPLARLALLLPYPLRGLHALVHGTGEMGRQLGFCQQTSVGRFLLSPNLGRPEIQNYLFDLFALNFQWLLLIPIGAAALIVVARRGKDRAAARADRMRVDWPALALLGGFLAAELYTITRCPVWNNVKYVLQPMPLYLLIAYGASLYAWPARLWRTVFLAVVAALFGASAVRTFDPLSLAFYGSVAAGEHTMLCMNSRTRVPEERNCGNDELTYNLQPFIDF